ncbi:MAG: TIGR03905 family TSCPD domain-containing protein [Erysipelotrichaceae bacterium]|nr:TIGR03905 family TSCPD domain-containing protein [Erysipelotrichaceae bacterium]
METLVYNPQGVCSKQFVIEHEDGKIVSIKVLGGCSGNLQGISKLLVGMPIKEVINRLEGIRCGMRSTSCPDQISKALKTI